MTNGVNTVIGIYNQSSLNSRKPTQRFNFNSGFDKADLDNVQTPYGTINRMSSKKVLVNLDDPVAQMLRAQDQVQYVVKG